MRVDVVGRQVHVTDTVRAHAESKVEKLTRYFDGTQQITCTITKPDHNHLYRVELVVDVEKHEEFVCHADGDDLLTAIDAAVAKSQRQLTDYKDKLKQSKRS